MTTQANRLAEIRKAIKAGNVSCGELSELQDLAAEFPELLVDDPLLAEWAGIPEEKWRQGIKPATHTAGPWSVDYEGPAHLSIGDKSGRVLAFCNLQGEDVVEDIANARLIAAAPDLLEALRGLLRETKAKNPSPKAGKNFSLLVYIEAARKAIARAEGEQ